MEICELKRKDEKEWDEFILRATNATFYHQIGWKNVVERTYGHKPCYLIARENGEIIGVLPLFSIESRIFGRKLVSVPFSPYGGVCAGNQEVESSLLEKAQWMAKEKNVDYLEFRCLSDTKGGLITNDAYFTLILKLTNDSELLWEKFSRKVRNAVRKALKSNLVAVIDNKYYKDFYRIYSKNMRDLGTPVHADSFFRNLLLEFPEQTKIAVVKYEGKIIGGIFLLYFRNTIISGWASSDKSYQWLNPNNLMYWEAIKHGCEEGYDYFDFGRSIADSGTYHFKMPWGTELKQLYYQYYLNNTKEMPDISQINPNRRMFAKVWKKLPLSLTNIIGPSLRRGFA